MPILTTDKANDHNNRHEEWESLDTPYGILDFPKWLNPNFKLKPSTSAAAQFAMSAETEENCDPSWFMDEEPQREPTYKERYRKAVAEQVIMRSVRKLDDQLYLGTSPVPKPFYDYIQSLGISRVNERLFWHYWGCYHRQLDYEPIFVDWDFRNFKTVKGKKPLARSSFNELMEANLVELVEEHDFIEHRAATYRPSTSIIEKYMECINPDKYSLSDMQLVNPETGYVYKLRGHALNNAPKNVVAYAKRCTQGPQINLAAVFAHHNEIHKANKELFTRKWAELNPDEQAIVGKIQSNTYNLLGIIINQAIPAGEPGEVILRQYFAMTSTGRLILRDGGFANLSRDYRAIALEYSSMAHTYTDYDLASAQVNLLLTLADQMGIQLPALEYYASNKAIRQKWADAIGFGCTAEEVKTSVIQLMFGAGAPQPNSVNFSKGEFPKAYIKRGGDECYAKAYAQMKSILDDVDLISDKVYEEYKANSYAHKGQRWVRNAVGVTQAFWDKNGNPIKGDKKDKEGNPIGDKETTRRKLMAHILQGLEQYHMHQIVLNMPETGCCLYMHDGVLTDAELSYHVGRVKLEAKPVVVQEEVTEEKPQTQAQPQPVQTSENNSLVSKALSAMEFAALKAKCLLIGFAPVKPEQSLMPRESPGSMSWSEFQARCLKPSYG